MKKLVSVLFVVLCLICGSALAQNTYVGAGGAFGWNNFNESEPVTLPSLDVDKADGSWAIHLFLGYSFTSNIAIEGSYSYNFGWTPDGNKDEEPAITRWSILGSVKVSILTDSTFVPYILVGLGWGGLASDKELLLVNGDGSFDFTQGGFVGRVGSGVEYKISENIKAFSDVGYNFAFQALRDWDFTDLRAGLVYGF